MADVFLENLTHERNKNLFLAWHVEALARTEKLPDLSTLQDDAVKEKKVQTPEEQLAQIKMLNAMFGGVINEC